MGYEFEWDRRKAAANLRKHDVTFEEAATVFADPLAINMLDPAHSTDEERYLPLGMSVQQRVLVVAYAERGRRTRLM